MSRNTLIPPSPGEDDYASTGTESLLSADDGPLPLFSRWFEDAKTREPNDPNAMALATVDTAGMPDVRMVLLKDFDARGFVFYTNLDSAKGVELMAQPKAALLFHWKSLRRQVRIRGSVERVTDAEADAYFATRARSSQIGAWASAQSRPMPEPHALEKAAAKLALKFGVSAPPRPPFWSGFRLVPGHFEFWRDRPFRLHERLVFERAGEEWTTERLYP
jgi:pyridoxamine 5'-phosphate oxidase